MQTPLLPSRRQFLGGSLGGFFALAGAQQSLIAASPQGKAKRCLILCMNGCPSQFETFDPKPGQHTGGPTKAIPTTVKGLEIAETLPQIARRMHHLSVLRNLTSREGEHERAQYYLHTGYKFVEAFPRPALGSMVSKQAPVQAIPNYVAIGAPGYGPAFLGADHGPFSIEQPAQARRLLRVIEARRSRLQLTRELNAEFDRTHSVAAVERRVAVLDRIEQLIDTPFSRALDLDSVSQTERERYGESDFAQHLLLARCMLEINVPFVEVVLNGWDTHSQNFPQTDRLCRTLDQPWAMLLDDLEASGLLDETLLVWMGEFGRTPTINAEQGRDHFPQVTPAVIGGAGIATGQVLGQTTSSGTAIKGDAHHVPDLFATLFTVLGLDPRVEFPTDFGSMTKATDGGKAIAQLL